MEFNIIKDYISVDKPSEVIYSKNGVYLCKNITPIYTLITQDQLEQSIIGYQCLRLCISQNFESKKIVEDNFDLIWVGYGEGNYSNNILDDSIQTIKEYWQNKNLENFNQFLKENPLLYTDGNYYGVEEIDRNEMSQQFLSYQIKSQAGLNPTGIQWHNKKKACKEFTLEEFLTLTLAIEQYTIPYYNLMQSRKEAIFDCTEKIDIFKIPINYEINEIEVTEDVTQSE